MPLAIGVILFTGWFVFLRPIALGGPIGYTIVAGSSMEPTFQSGDFVAMRHRQSYAPGDIISYTIPHGEPGSGYDVIHRIVSSDSHGFITRGDNNDVVDPWTPAYGDIIGKLWFRVPVVGRALAIVRSPLFIGTVGGGLTAFLIMRRPERREVNSSPDPVRTPASI